MSNVTIDSVKTSGSRIVINYTRRGQIKKFFERGPFLADYNVPVDGVPDSLLVIPFLATVCPVAWVNNATVHVETLDETFLRSLDEVRLAYQKFYPKVKFINRIHVNKITSVTTGINPKSGLLFSGGIDSLATYIRHRHEKPFLIAVHGADIAINNIKGWRAAATKMAEFSAVENVPFRTVRSNFRSLVDELRFKLCFEGRVVGDWWGQVMHGLALLGLCAPLTSVDKIGTLYIASTFTSLFNKPWGSAPKIDNNVAWANTMAVHDGYELTRQKKVNLIADYVKQTGSSVYIRSCFGSLEGDNCNKCEKCSRTIVGLELAGIDPNNHGFKVSSATFKTIKDKLRLGHYEFRAGAGAYFRWTALQNYARRHKNLPHPEAEELVSWIAKTKISSITSRVNKRQKIMSLVIPTLKYMPPFLYHAIKKLLTAFKFLP